MIQREDIAHLIRKYNLMQCEIDSRHIELLNEIYALGFQDGKTRAKAALSWRINGNLMVKMINEDICP